MKTIHMIILLLLTFGALCQICRNQDGEDVDWWIIMKYPKLDDPDPDISAGYGYVYADSDDKRLSTSSITLRDSSRGAIPNTLKGMYSANTSDSDDIGYIHYNNEFNGKKYGSNGHTKGLVILDDSGGAWLIHSIPRFPPAPPDNYEFPDNELIYGQSMICISISSSDFDSVGTQLMYNKIKVNAYYLSSALSEQYPNIASAAAGKHYLDYENSQSSYIELRSRRGKSFKSFAKTGNADMNLYEDFVEPTYNDGMYVESWRRNPLLPSFCTPAYSYASMNVHNVTLDGRTFAYTKDHSKWGVFIDQESFCIGDINRMSSQTTRGGGTICTEDSSIYNGLKSAIDYIEPCT